MGMRLKAVAYALILAAAAFKDGRDHGAAVQPVT